MYTLCIHGFCTQSESSRAVTFGFTFSETKVKNRTVHTAPSILMGVLGYTGALVIMIQSYLFVPTEKSSESGQSIFTGHLHF